jgi:DNA-binding MarR family transcriptional regulator
MIVGSKSKSNAIAEEPAPELDDAALRQAIEMLFFAYRDFIAEPDAMLVRHGLGRAHHRAIYFIGRYPGITMKELLGILKITKQSLNRVLAGLFKDGYADQTTSDQDRRRRLIKLTEKGRELERQLTENQRIRIARAYRDAGADAVAGFRTIMLGIMSNDEDCHRFETHEEG